MAANQEKTTESDTHTPKIDRTAPAGSENSLGAQSVRDGRPVTDDSVVEAMDEGSRNYSSPSRQKGLVLIRKAWIPLGIEPRRRLRSSDLAPLSRCPLRRRISQRWPQSVSQSAARQ